MPGRTKSPALERTGLDAVYVALGIVAGLVAVVAFWTLRGALDAGSVGIDYAFYRDIGARWLETGVYYLPHQLAGPYDVRLMEDVLYPPAALVLFVPLVYLPTILWWAVPLGVLVYVIAGFRPSPWGWVAILAVCLWPRIHGAIVFGNTDMWVSAGVAAGLRWGWPAALVALKPVFLPLALVGIRHRSTWVIGIVLLVVSLPMLADYITVLRNVRVGWDYSLGSVPFATLPIVAWLGRRVTGQLDEDQVRADDALARIRGVVRAIRGV